MLNKKVGVLMLLAFCIAGCGGKNMMKGKTPTEIIPETSKATLVIYRTQTYSSVKEIPTYLDKAYIGSTMGKSYFVAKVDPGVHYVIGYLGNKMCKKITVEAKKVYYLQQLVYPGFAYSNAAFIGQTLKEFEAEKGKMDYLIINPDANSSMSIGWERKEEYGKPLDEKEYEEIIADYEKEEKENLKKHENTDTLKGY
jgi:hypothetical protein